MTAETRTIPVELDPALAEGLAALALVDGLGEDEVMQRALAAYLRARTVPVRTRTLWMAGAGW